MAKKAKKPVNRAPVCPRAEQAQPAQEKPSAPEREPSGLEILVGTDRYLASFREDAESALEFVHDTIGAVSTILDFEAYLASEDRPVGNIQGITEGLAQIGFQLQREIGIVQEKLEKSSQTPTKQYPGMTVAPKETPKTEVRQ